MLMDELADAHEHLGSLIQEATENEEYTEEEFRIDLGHVYAHLNRAWYRRHVSDDLTEADWNVASAFPHDLEPLA